MRSLKDHSRIDRYHMRSQSLFQTEKSLFLAFEIESDVMIYSLKRLCCTTVFKELTAWHSKFTVI